MKKYLIVTVISLMMSFVGFTQNSQNDPCDTVGKVWIPRADAVRVLNASQQKRILDTVVKLLKEDVASLSEINLAQEREIRSLNRTITLGEQKYTFLETAFNKQEELFQARLGFVEKELKKQKRKTKIAAGLGVLGTVGGAVLVILATK